MADLERDELGERYLRSMHRYAGVRQAMAEGITRDSFKFGCQKAWDYFVSFQNTHKRLPHLSDVRDKTGVDLRSVKPEPYEYVSKRVRERKLADSIFESLEEIAVKAEDGDVAVARALLISKAAELREDEDAETYGSYNQSSEGALKAYERQFKGAEDGTVKTPWPTLNRAIGNLVPGTLTVALAAPSVGKTWLSCACAYHAAMQGKHVLLISMEMTRSQISRRIDSILCEVPFSDLRDIGSDPSTLNTYLQVKRKLPFRRRAVKGEITVIDERKVQTPEHLLAAAYKGNYDLVIVDGAYRLETGNRFDNAFDVQRKVAKQLQQYAKVLKPPFLATSQYNEQNDNKGQRRTQMALEHARYSKEYGTNADVVIGLQPKSEIFGEYCLEFQLLKIREGSNKCQRSFVANWNVNARGFYEKFGEREEEILEEDDTDAVYGDL